MKTTLSHKSFSRFRRANLVMMLSLVVAISPVYAAPEVLIKARLVEISTNDPAALGFSWYLGNLLINSANRKSAATPLWDTNANVLGILTAPELRNVLKAIEQRKGADLLNEGQVTTLSGRQAQLSVTRDQTSPTGTNSGNPFSVTLDVVPYIGADGNSVQLTLIPTITELAGYDQPGAFVPSIITNGTANPVTGTLPLPHSRVRQVMTSCIVWDGQTVVLGGLITGAVHRPKDSVPFLGDLPLVGRAFRSDTNNNKQKNLLFFVTPTIIDPDGNRVHPEALPDAVHSKDYYDTPVLGFGEGFGAGGGGFGGR